MSMRRASSTVWWALLATGCYGGLASGSGSSSGTNTGSLTTDSSSTDTSSTSGLWWSHSYGNDEAMDNDRAQAVAVSDDETRVAIVGSERVVGGNRNIWVRVLHNNPAPDFRGHPVLDCAGSIEIQWRGRRASGDGDEATPDPAVRTTTTQRNPSGVLR